MITESLLTYLQTVTFAIIIENTNSLTQNTTAEMETFLDEFSEPICVLLLLVLSLVTCAFVR